MWRAVWSEPPFDKLRSSLDKERSDAAREAGDYSPKAVIINPVRSSRQAAIPRPRKTPRYPQNGAAFLICGGPSGSTRSAGRSASKNRDSRSGFNEGHRPEARRVITPHRVL